MARFAKNPVAPLAKDWGGNCGAGVGTGDCTSGMEIPGAPLVLLGWIVRSDHPLFFAFTNDILSRRS